MVLGLTSPYFHDLVQRCFASLESALGMVDQLLGLTEEEAAESFRKIQMRPLVSRGPVSPGIVTRLCHRLRLASGALIDA